MPSEVLPEFGRNFLLYFSAPNQFKEATTQMFLIPSVVKHRNLNRPNIGAVKYLQLPVFSDISRQPDHAFQHGWCLVAFHCNFLEGP